MGSKLLGMMQKDIAQLKAKQLYIQNLYYKPVKESRSIKSSLHFVDADDSELPKIQFQED